MSAVPAAAAPPFSYSGGKTILAARIATVLPTHDHFVEVFGGSMAVLLANRLSRMDDDLDSAVQTFWRVLREQPEALARVCALTPHSRSERNDCADLDAVGDDLELARRVCVRLTQGRAGTLLPTGWRHF